MTLTMCYDPGTSLTKILYEEQSLPDDSRRLKYLTMLPELLSLSTTSRKKLPTHSGLGRPQDNAWVQLSEDGDCYAVGRTAINHRATVSVKPLKHTILIPKLLAAVGAIAEIEELGNEFPLDLALLIPYGELGNEAKIEQELVESLSCFYFREQQMKVKLETLNCTSEGTGCVLDYIRRQGIQDFREKTIAFLMLGYRNTSLLLFRSGTLDKKASSTTELGFFNFIDEFRSLIPSKSREQIQSALWNRKDESSVFVDLSEQVRMDPDEISASFRSALSDYWGLLESWMREVLPPVQQLDFLIGCGGTAHFLSSRLEKFMGDKFSLFDESSRDLLSALKFNLKQLKQFEKQKLSARFVDCWGFYVNFAEYPVEPERVRTV